MQVTPRVRRCRKHKTSTCENGQTNLGIISSHHFDPSAPTKPALARQLEPFIEPLVWSSAHASTCARILLQLYACICRNTLNHAHARTPRITQGSALPARPGARLLRWRRHRARRAAKKPVTKRGGSLLSPNHPPRHPATRACQRLGYAAGIHDSDI